MMVILPVQLYVGEFGCELYARNGEEIKGEADYYDIIANREAVEKTLQEKEAKRLEDERLENNRLYASLGLCPCLCSYECEECLCYFFASKWVYDLFTCKWMR